jgi:AcrR family transcriptional regulator
MSPRTPKQFEEIRHEKKHLIMDSALELFASIGYESTTISQIAIKAGISKGLLYNYFKSKEELIEDVLNHGIDKVFALYDPNRDGVLEPDEMEFFINETFRILKENLVFWKLYYSICMQPSVYKFIKKRMDEFTKPVMKMTMEYFQAQGFENPTAEAYFFDALLDGISIDFVMAPDKYPIDKIRRELITRYCKLNIKTL